MCHAWVPLDFNINMCYTKTLYGITKIKNFHVNKNPLNVYLALIHHTLFSIFLD